MPKINHVNLVGI